MIGLLAGKHSHLISPISPTFNSRIYLFTFHLFPSPSKSTPIFKFLPLYWNCSLGTVTSCQIQFSVPFSSVPPTTQAPDKHCALHGYFSLGFLAYLLLWFSTSEWFPSVSLIKEAFPSLLNKGIFLGFCQVFFSYLYPFSLNPGFKYQLAVVNSRKLYWQGNSLGSSWFRCLFFPGLDYCPTWPISHLSMILTFLPPANYYWLEHSLPLSKTFNDSLLLSLNSLYFQPHFL